MKEPRDLTYHENQLLIGFNYYKYLNRENGVSIQSVRDFLSVYLEDEVGNVKFFVDLYLNIENCLNGLRTHYKVIGSGSSEGCKIFR